MRTACSNVLRHNILRHQPRVIRQAASVALSSQLKPIAWQRSALVATRRFTAATENNTVDYEYIQKIIKDNKQVSALLLKENSDHLYNHVRRTSTLLTSESLMNCCKGPSHRQKMFPW